MRHAQEGFAWNQVLHKWAICLKISKLYLPFEAALYLTLWEYS